MGWFQSNRKPFSAEFLQRLDEIEAALNRLDPIRHRRVEVIPVAITGTEVRDGVEVNAWREITTDGDPQVGGRSSDGVDESNEPDEFAFAATRPEEGKAFVLKHYVAGDSLHEERYTLIEGGPRRSFLARISDANPIANNDNRWEYGWVEVQVDASGAFTDRTNGRTSADLGKAYNTVEAFNNGNGVEGPGWDLDNAPGTFAIQPIQSCVVEMRLEQIASGAFVPLFSMANVLDGECEDDDEEGSG